MDTESLSRREFLVGSAAAVTAVGTTLRSTLAAEAAPRPNILCFVCEDSNPRIGAYGDKLAHTPAIDRLAREGVMYRYMYSTAPVCGPSRFAIITGMYGETAAPGNNMTAMAELPSFVRGFPAYLREAGYYCTNNNKKNYVSNLDFATDIWDESSNKAHWRNRPQGKPFFAVFNTLTTHESRIFPSTPPPPNNEVKPEDVRVPAFLPDNAVVRHDLATVYGRMEQMDDELRAHVAELEADGVLDDTIVFYYSDHGGTMPRGKRFCYDDGTRIPLVIRFPEKWAHLAPGKPGTVVNSPASLVDLAPTILSILNLPIPKYVQGQVLFGPSAAAPRKFAFSGRNRMDERFDMIRTVTEGRCRYLRNYSPHRIWGQHGAFMWQALSYQEWEKGHLAGTLNTAQERFWNTKPYEEFYDLEADPDEVNNLIASPEHRAHINEMRQALDTHMLEINDNGFIPEGCALQGYEESRKPGAYPLQRIMKLAEMAANCNSANLAHFRNDLFDSNEVVRFWAAQGLLILGESAKGAVPDLRKALADDTSQFVRVVAAEALVRLVDDSEGRLFLVRTLENQPDTRLRLFAINSVTYLKSDTYKLAVTGTQKAAESDDEYLHDAGRYLGLVRDGTYTPASPVFDNDLFRRYGGGRTQGAGG